MTYGGEPYGGEGPEGSEPPPIVLVPEGEPGTGAYGVTPYGGGGDAGGGDSPPVVLELDPVQITCTGTLTQDLPDSVPPPTAGVPGDLFAYPNAVVLTDGVFLSDPWQVMDATSQEGEYAKTGGYNAVWFRFEPPASTFYDISTFDSQVNSDTVLTVLYQNGSTMDSLIMVGQNNQYNENRSRLPSIFLSAGAVYYIAVSWWSLYGTPYDFRLRVTRQAPPMLNLDPVTLTGTGHAHWAGPLPPFEALDFTGTGNVHVTMPVRVLELDSPILVAGLSNLDIDFTRHAVADLDLDYIVLASDSRLDYNQMEYVEAGEPF